MYRLPWKTDYFRQWGEEDGWNGSFASDCTPFIDQRLAEYNAALVQFEIFFQSAEDKLAFKIRYG